MIYKNRCIKSSR